MGSKRTRYKGCCGMCAFGNGRVRGQGWVERLKGSERRKFGKKRRVGRNEIPADQLRG